MPAERLFAALIFGLLLALAGVAHTQDIASGDHVQVRWLAPDTLAAGETTTIGFHFQVDPGWHVYWQNPGDSGAAPRFAITASGAEVGPIQWPFPERLPIEHLTNLGYEGNVAYLLDITPTAGAQQVSLAVDLEWLVCEVDCIPGFGSMSLSRPVTGETRWREADRALVESFSARIPGGAIHSPWRALSLEPAAQHLTLTLSGAGTAQVFPVDGNLLTAAAPQVHTEGDVTRYTFPRVPGMPLTGSGDFVVSDGEHAWLLDGIAIGSVSAGTTLSTILDTTSALWLLVLAAFVGGVILNLMPCVFPVLSIKLFGLINAGGDGRSRVREGLFYTAGVLATFAALGALLLGLRAGGAAVGWGFQLQSAPVVLALIALFWLMALSFSGFFEFGHRLMSLAGSHRGGSFGTGVLAVFVAAPCTGPFMGAALGAAAVLPAASALAIFLGLGAGLAAPFLLLCISPALLKRLPAPGPWMDRLRQFMAFPLYATVIWLLWVLGRLSGDSGWVIGSLVLLALVFALWLGQNFARGGRLTGYAVALAAFVLALGALRAADSTFPQQDHSVWQPYDSAAIAQARAQNRPVFIDYTAAWCITCQVNKKVVLDTPAVEELFRAHNVLLIRADWTSHNPAITESLAALGRNSVPVYAWYAPGARRAEILPQVLQERMIRDLFTDDYSMSQ